MLGGGAGVITLKDSELSALAEKIRELRQNRGMSQQNLAAAADVAVNTVWAAENGRFRPRARTLRRLAEALGIPFEELLHGAPRRPPGAGDALGEYLRGRAAGRLSETEVEHLGHLIERLVEAEIEARGRGRRLKERSPRYGSGRAADKPTGYD